MCLYKLTNFIVSSFLDFEGTYDDGEDGRPLRLFAVHNDTDTDVNTKWAGKPVFIKAGDMRECGHAEAYYLTKFLTDREIFKEADKETDVKVRERKEMGVLSPHIRKPYEDRFLREVIAGEESPVMKKLREDAEKKVRAEIKSDEAAAGVTKSGKVKKEVAFEDNEK